MTKEEIFEMARQAGFEGCAELTWENVVCTEELEAFAKLVEEKAIKEALAQEQEPVAWITPDGEGFRIRFSPPVNDVPLGWDALYTTPPQRKPLLDEEINDIAKNYALNNPTTPLHFARAIESAHGIKETEK